MKVLFLKFLPNVGHEGEIKEVSHAYANNFLIPKGFAKKIDEAEEKKILNDIKKKEESRRKLIENKHKIVELLNGKEISFEAKKQDNNKIYGSVGEKEIIAKLREEFDIELEKKHIDMGPDGHMKKPGSRFIFIKLSPDSIAKINVTIK